MIILKKNRFIMLETEEEFKKYEELQQQDNIELANLFNDLAEKGMRQEFNFALLNIGTLLQTISVFLELKNKEVDKIFKLEKDQIKQRKMTVIINEINEKINLKYDLDEDTEIAKTIYGYDGLCYLRINKTLFIQLLFGKGIIDFGNTDSI